MVSRVKEYLERRGQEEQAGKQDQQAYQKHLLAVVKRLGLPSGGNLEKTILRYLTYKVEQTLEAHDISEPPGDANDLIGVLAPCFKLEIVEIYNATDLKNLLNRLAREPLVNWLKIELQYNYAMTIRRQARTPWEQPFLAVIDCRKDPHFGGLFSKWHEIAHLLLDPHMSQHIYRRSCGGPHDPEELLADRITQKFYKLYISLPFGQIWSEIADCVKLWG